MIAGGGVIGLACGWRAAEAGLSVTIVDPGAARPGAGAVAAGMLAPVGEASWGEDTLLRLNLASAERWPAFARELEIAAGLEVPYRRCGSLHVALDRDEGAELKRRYRLQDGFSDSVEWLPGSAARRLEPALAPITAGAVHVPDEAEVDPRALIDALRSACAAAGVELVGGAVKSVEAGGGAVGGVILEGGRRIAAAAVVIAAGAWSGADGFGLPVRPVAGDTVRLRAWDGELPTERIVVGERFYIVPRTGGELVVGASVEERGFDTRVRAGGIHELLREAYRAVPEIAELELVEVAAALRPGTPDNAPILGAAPNGPSGLLFATGHYRNGILLAPISAEGIAAILSGGEAPGCFAGLGPERFAKAGAGVGAPA